MSKQEDKTEDKPLEFDVMPGADKPEDEDSMQLDLSFPDLEEKAEEETVAEEEIETVAEEETETVAEEVEEVEESVSEDEQSTEEETELAAELEDEPVEPEKPTKKPMVPKARLDEVLAKQKALQKQLDEINAATEKAAEAPEEYDFDAKEVEYQNMVLDGETDKAVALRREIRKAERATLEFEMRQEMSQTVTQDRQMTALQQAANAMEEAYPVFNSNSESFDQDMTNEVVELRDAFIMKGYEAVDALSKAVKYVVKDHDLDQAQESAPSLAGKAQKTDEVAKKRAQVNKKLRAAEAQPPELPGESSANHGDKPLDVSTLTEDEFAALPEATLKRLRGDIM
jgi:hypothetical protein